MGVVVEAWGGGDGSEKREGSAGLSDQRSSSGWVLWASNWRAVVRHASKSGGMVMVRTTQSSPDLAERKSIAVGCGGASKLSSSCSGGGKKRVRSESLSSPSRAG